VADSRVCGNEPSGSIKGGNMMKMMTMIIIMFQHH
jgi:hypothetical protein